MKKSHAFNILSTKTCPCGTRIKLRLENNDTCYDCYRIKESKRGHYINAASRKSRIEAGLIVKTFKGGALVL